MEQNLRAAYAAFVDAVSAARAAGYVVTWPKREGEPIGISETSRVQDEGVDVIGGFVPARSRHRRRP